MGKCVNHPDRETNYLCMKHDVYMCQECLKCRDPELYCKFRSSCPIWFVNKEKLREERRRKAQAAVSTSRSIFDSENTGKTTQAGGDGSGNLRKKETCMAHPEN